MSTMDGAVLDALRGLGVQTDPYKVPLIPSEGQVRPNGADPFAKRSGISYSNLGKNWGLGSDGSVMYQKTGAPVGYGTGGQPIFDPTWENQGKLWTADSGPLAELFNKDRFNAIMNNDNGGHQGGQLNVGDLTAKQKKLLGLEDADNGLGIKFNNPLTPGWGMEVGKKRSWLQENGTGIGAAIAMLTAGIGGALAGGGAAAAEGVGGAGAAEGIGGSGVAEGLGGAGLAAPGTTGSFIGGDLLASGAPAVNFGGGMTAGAGSLLPEAGFAGAGIEGTGALIEGGTLGGGALSLGGAGTGIVPGAGALLPSGGFPGAGISASGALSDGGTLGNLPVSTNGAGTGLFNGGEYTGKDVFSQVKGLYDKYGKPAKQVLDALRGKSAGGQPVSIGGVGGSGEAYTPYVNSGPTFAGWFNPNQRA